MNINYQRSKQYGLGVCLIFLYLTLQATPVSRYPFGSVKDAERFQNLTTLLRCVVCPNQNLAESNAIVARDLKDRIYQAIQIGEPDQKILRDIKIRYGDFVSFLPPFRECTALLWLGPWLILSLGLMIFYKLFRN